MATAPENREWPELLEADPDPVIELLKSLYGTAKESDMQMLARLQRPGHPTLILGYEPEDYVEGDEISVIYDSTKDA